MRVACVIPTYNGKDDLERLLNSIKVQSYNFDLLVVDSCSTDGTLDVARKYLSNGVISELVIIDSRDFNHGGTRQKMVDDFPDYDVYVFLTQDVLLEDEFAIAEIIKPFFDMEVGAVCGRQLPHFDADLIAQHARFFNYPSNTLVKSKDDIKSFGIKTSFMSNSFSAYRKTALDEIGGFPKHVILSEDMYVASRMLLSNYKIVYSGKACCRHSHNYSISEEFNRYFDIGVFHAREPWIRDNFGGAGGEGWMYVKSEINFIGIERIYLWPSAIFRNACKLIAYELGKKEDYIPAAMKKKIGMFKGYWSGPFAEKK